MIRGAIFDVDGTLLDTMKLWQRVASEYLRSLGVQPRPDVDAVTKDLSLPKAAAYLRRTYSLSRSEADIQADVNRWVEDMYRKTAQPKPGVAAFLQVLYSRGVPMCVATATDAYLVELALIRCDLRRYFGRIYSCTDVGAGKDEPLIFEQALDSLGTPRGETWVFEDALYAARTAKAAGFPVAAIRDPSEPGQPALRALADVYLPDFTQAAQRLLEA